MARRIGTPAPVAQQVPNVPAPAYPAAPVAPPPVQAVPAVPQMPLAPPQVPGMPVQAPPMEQQLAQAVYQAPVAPPAVPMTQAPPVTAVPHTAPAGQSPLHIDMGPDEVKVFKVVPAGTVVEAEITKAELGKSSNGNNQLKTQLRVTWPQAYVGAIFSDFCTLTKEAFWKAKSLYSVCEDENGNRLLSEDNRFFTGQSETDLVGNVVRFTADEPRPGSNNPGVFFNQVKGGFSAAFETFAGEETTPHPDSPNINVPTPATPIAPPPVPQF